MTCFCKGFARPRQLQVVKGTFPLAPVLGLLLTGCSSAPVVSGGGGVDTQPPPPIATTLAVTPPDGPVTQGQSMVLHVAVTPSRALGTVSVTDAVLGASKSVSGILEQGAVDIAVQPPVPGIRSYTVSYPGDGTYAESSASVQVAVSVPASASSCGLGSAAYLVSSGSASPQQTSFSSTLADQSAVCAQDAGTALTLTSPAITKSGAESSLGVLLYGTEPSGIDAGVLAYGSSATSASGAAIDLEGSPTLSATGASYAAFASGMGASINLSNAVITSTLSTATVGSGNNGQIAVNNSSVTSDGNLLVVVDGGSADLQSTSLTTTGHTAPILLAGPDDGSNAANTFRMTGGSIASPEPLFSFQGNQTANVYLSQVDLSKVATDSGTALDSIAQDGTLTLQLTLDGQTIQGTVAGTSGSSLTLQNGSSLDGDFTGGGNATMDASSAWTIHSDLTLQVFSDADAISGTAVSNVTGNGNSISYSKALNPKLGGVTYTLKNGGVLKPY